MKKVIIIIITILILGPIVISTRGGEHILTGIGVSFAIAAIAYAPLVKLLAPNLEGENNSNYEVNFSGNTVYIKYNNREFCTEIKNIRTNNNKVLRDQYGKKASQTLNFQILNDIRHKYSELCQKNLKGKMLLKKEEIISKFKDIRPATEEEKQEYFKYLKRQEKHYEKFLNFFILFIIISMILSKNFLFWVVMPIFLIIIGFKKMFLAQCDVIVFEEGPQKNFFIAECYAYEVIARKKKLRHSYIMEYYIKITDNKTSYLEEEFKVDYQSVNTNDNIKAFLYVIENNGEYLLDVCTENMLKS